MTELLLLVTLSTIVLSLWALFDKHNFTSKKIKSKIYTFCAISTLVTVFTLM